MKMEIVENKISKNKLSDIAKEQFGDMLKAVVDVEKEIIGIGGELHMDIATLLIEKAGSQSKNIWGINLYPKEIGDDFIEFDSMVNIKPSLANRSRDILDKNICEKIKKIVEKFII